MSLCWAFYYVNYNEIIDPNSPKVMCCIICYISLILISNPEIPTRNDLNFITYHKRNNCIEKNVSTNYYVLPKSFEEEMRNPLKGKEEKQLPNKNLNIPSSSISNLFCYKGTFQERWCVAKIIFGKFETFSYQQSFAFTICEECWLKCLSMHLCLKVVFLFGK
jgi:hypothetical protein